MKGWAIAALLMISCEVRSERSPEAPAATETATPTKTTPTPAITLPPAPAPLTPKQQVEDASLDYLKNGLAAVWDGRITTRDELMRWFTEDEASRNAAAQIVAEQSKREDRLLEAVITEVRLSPPGEAEADYFISVKKASGVFCYRGTQQWIQQPDGRWLRAAVSILKDVPGCAKEGAP